MKFLKENNKNQGTLMNMDLTPIVDVIFNLLIFFALSLNFASISSGIKVKLPTATSAEQVKSKDLTINLTNDGRIFFNSDEIKFESLAGELKKIENKEVLVIIKADNRVRHGYVVNTMDVVKTNGFSRLAIAVEKKE
ncbi:MAG: biopolymer transporter ExbD [Candidatus Dadabacteria bacterium]|nr:biopolymer transporter ExbD [Candidatus Dadabacteria bacterium]NIQ13018.1 biopolymer transporter ExbD [Candidatus Dadabacteria bacterium]